MMFDKNKSLDAKVQIHRLAIKYREISDLPYKSKEEKIDEEQILSNIKQIVDDTTFINDKDKRDFEDYLQEQLGGNDIDVPEPETEDEDDLAEMLDGGKPIEPIQQIRNKQKTIKEQIKELQDKKKELLLMKQRENLQLEIEHMEKQVSDSQKEEAYLTDPKNREGLIKLRHEKYNKKMDNLKMDKIQMEILLEGAKDDEERKIIKESLDLNKKKMWKLKSVKFHTYFQNAMIKIPRKIAGLSNSIAKLSDGIGNIGGDLNKYDKGGKRSGGADLMVGGNESKYDFGFNTKSMFGGGEKKEKKETKKRKKRRKSKKRR